MRELSQGAYPPATRHTKARSTPSGTKRKRRHPDVIVRAENERMSGGRTPARVKG